MRWRRGGAEERAQWSSSPTKWGRGDCKTAPWDSREVKTSGGLVFAVMGSGHLADSN